MWLTTMEPSRSAATAYRVLIVEDNPHIIEMYAYTLKKLAQGKDAPILEVHFADDGHAALNVLKAHSFHLVLTDIYMPVLDGFQLLERIRQEPSLQHLPVVAISAGGADAEEKARQLGATVYLRKPVRFADVVGTVRQILGL